MAKATCAIEDCDRPAKCRGWCSTHYQRWWRHGDPLAGGRVFGRRVLDGYVYLSVPGHPLASAKGWVREHRLVAWNAGLLTDPSDHVHHKNEDRGDNRLENLEVKSHAHHASDHAVERWRRRHEEEAAGRLAAVAEAIADGAPVTGRICVLAERAIAALDSYSALQGRSRVSRAKEEEAHVG